MTDFSTYEDDRYLGLPGPWGATWYACAACGRGVPVTLGAAAKRHQWDRILPNSPLGDRINAHATPYGATAGWLQASFGLQFETAAAILSVATAFGLLDQYGTEYRRAPALCGVCYETLAEAALNPPEPPVAAPKPTDPGRDAIPAQLRFRVLQRDAFRCQYCGRTAGSGATLHVDHIKPVTLGGSTDEGNLLTACEQCNLGKSRDEVVPD